MTHETWFQCMAVLGGGLLGRIRLAFDVLRGRPVRLHVTLQSDEQSDKRWLVVRGVSPWWADGDAHEDDLSRRSSLRFRKVS